MIEIKQKDNESRKDYLVRVAIEFIKENSGLSWQANIVYDDAECDGHCLAIDLAEEFEIHE